MTWPCSYCMLPAMTWPSSYCVLPAMTRLSCCELHSRYSRSSLLPFCSARTHVSQLFPQIFSRKTAVNGDRNCCRLDAFPVLAASLRWEGATVWVPSNLFFLLSEGKKKNESGWIGTQWWRSRLAHGRPWVLHPQHKGKNKSSFAGQCHTLALLCLEARAPCTAQVGLELMTLLSLPLRFSQQCPETSQP